MMSSARYKVVVMIEVSTFKIVSTKLGYGTFNGGVCKEGT